MKIQEYVPRNPEEQSGSDNMEHTNNELWPVSVFFMVGPIQSSIIFHFIFRFFSIKQCCYNKLACSRSLTQFYYKQLYE
jgi:hypothetical protein